MKPSITILTLLTLLMVACGPVCVNDGYCDDFEEILGCPDCEQPLPDSCTMSGGISCGPFHVIGEADSRVELTLINKAGTSLEEAKISLHTTYCDIIDEEVYIDGPIANGGQMHAQFDCSDNLEPGERFKADLEVEFRKTGATVWHSAFGDLYATVIGEDVITGVEDTLREGEEKTYTLGDMTYTVTLIFVSDVEPPEAKFMVNGEVTPAMRKGDVYRLECADIGVNNILVNPRDGVAEFWLHAKECIPEPPVPEGIYDSMYLNDTKVYDYGGVTYEISFINVNPNEAQFMVNGEVTDWLAEGEEYQLAAECMYFGLDELMWKPTDALAYFHLVEGDCSDPIPTHEYENFDVVMNTATFEVIETSAKIDVTLDGSDVGVIQYNNKEYLIHKKDSDQDVPPLDVDTDADGKFDTVVYVDKVFALI